MVIEIVLATVIVRVTALVIVKKSNSTQKTQNPEGRRKGTSKDLYRPYLRPKTRAVPKLLFLEPNMVAISSYQQDKSFSRTTL